MRIAEQLAAVVWVQPQALQLPVPEYPAYQVAAVCPAAQVRTPSYIRQRPGGDATTGTQICPVVQPPPIVVVAQKRLFIPHVGVPGAAAPVGWHAPLTEGMNALAMTPYELPLVLYHSGLVQSIAGVSCDGVFGVPLAHAAAVLNDATVVLHEVGGRAHEQPLHAPGIRPFTSAVAFG